MDAARTAVRPLSPVAPWMGGKRHLAQRIVQKIDLIPHEMYAEAFVGMGGVFLRRASRPRVEVINDLGRDVSNFFRVLQRHHTTLVEYLQFQVTSRAEFERLIATDPETLTDIERAARFVFLQRTAFGGKVVGRNFGVSAMAPAHFNALSVRAQLEAVHARLSGVVIESLDFETFMDRYDARGALFYLDPPYWGCERDYGDDLFARSDFQRLADIVGKMKARFILSINDTPEVRDLFGAFEIEPVRTTYTISGPAQKVQELIISNAAPGPLRLATDHRTRMSSWLVIQAPEGVGRRMCAPRRRPARARR
jgi:DNA adenine methylase